MVWQRKGSSSTSSRHLVVYLPDLSGAPRTVDVAENLQNAIKSFKNRNGAAKLDNALEFGRRCTGAMEFESLEIVKYTIHANKRDGSRTDDEEEALMDVIQFPYQQYMATEERPRFLGLVQLGHLLELSLGLVWFTILIVMAMGRSARSYIPGVQDIDGHSRRQVRTALPWMISFYFGAIIYWVVLVWSLFEVASQGIPHELVGNVTIGITILLILLSFLAPGTLVRRGSELHEGMMLNVRYLLLDNVRQSMQQGLRKLLEQSKKEWGCYEQVSLVGYSAGSLLAMDAVYPFEQDAKLGKTIPSHTVNNLITVACPFRSVCALLPNYFNNNRVVAEAHAFEWTNIFIPTDAFGSSFNSDCTSSPVDVCATIDVNGNHRKESSVAKESDRQNRKACGLPTNNILYQRGLDTGGSLWFQELQLTMGFFVGYSIYVHFLYVVLTEDLHWVFDNTVAAHVVRALTLQDNQQTSEYEEEYCIPPQSRSAEVGVLEEARTAN